MNNHGTGVASRTPLYIEHPGNGCDGKGGPRTLVGWMVMYKCGCSEYVWA